MKGEEEQVKKSIEKIGVDLKQDAQEKLHKLTGKTFKQGMTPKDTLGLSDAMVEGIYGQAYRLYNTGKYKDASQLFRVLVMLNPLEPKYTIGLGACFHMMKDYKSAIDTYTLATVMDTESPIPFYHISDCYTQINDNVSAAVALEMAIKRAGDKPEYKKLKDRALLTLESLKKEINK